MRNLSKLGITVLVLASVLYTACGGGTKSVGQNALPQEKKNVNTESEELNRKLIQGTFSSAAADYPIGPGDLLSIEVLEAPDLKTDTRVNSQNAISFPLLGKVDIGGLTTQEAEQRIRELLTEKYMNDPHVVVAIKEYRSQRVAVIGSVKNPGTYELLGKGNLLDALALAGGLSEKASEVAYVSRKNTQGQEKSVQIDLNELLNEGKVDLNIPIHMGDVVYIPEAGVVYVDGAVQHPGSVPVKQNMTVSQAITAAGGLSKVAETSDVSLFRNKKGQMQTTPINLKDVRVGKSPDIVVEDQDVIMVGKNAIKSFFDSMHLGLFFPPFSVGMQ